MKNTTFDEFFRCIRYSGFHCMFATNSNVQITISLRSDGIYTFDTTFGNKDIAIRRSDVVSKTQFLFV